MILTPNVQQSLLDAIDRDKEWMKRKFQFIFITSCRATVPAALLETQDYKRKRAMLGVHGGINPKGEDDGRGDAQTRRFRVAALLSSRR